MSSNVLLYSSHLITDEELAEVMLQAKGVLTPDSPVGYFGGLIDGEAYVWVSRIPCYDGVFDWEGNPMDESDMVLLDQAKALLGGEFQNWIHIKLGRPAGSQRLAVRFAHICCQHWSCVVDTAETKARIFSYEEIEQLYQQHGSFTAYGL